MPSLLELQERFGAAIESGDTAFGPALDVYRRAITANYRRALTATYPVVRELLGDAAFDEAVEAFVATHPPVSGDLNIYGSEFPAFLERCVPSRVDARDMARLEWAIDESARAAEVDSTPADVVAALTGLEEDAVADAGFSLNPSCRLVDTASPTYETWCARQRVATAAAAAGGDAACQFLLVRRDAGRALVERISPAEFAWLSALFSGAALGVALAHAHGCEEHFQLPAVLRDRVREGVICAVKAP